MRKGQVVTFVRGTGKPDDSILRAKDEVAQLFRQMIDDVERNHATQVWLVFLPACWLLCCCSATAACRVYDQLAPSYLAYRTNDIDS